MTYRIGVDSRLLSQPITGIGRYTHEMLKRLTASGHEWFLYSHMPIIIGDWRRSNVHLRTSRLPGRPLRLLWAQLMLPRLASRDRVDLFWAPTHRLPRYLARDMARVVTVHDLVWKHAGDTMPAARRWMDANSMPEIARLADRIIAVSQNTANDLISEVPGCADKIDAIPLGVAEPGPRVADGALAEFGLTEPYFLFVGTLEPRKNLRRLIEAYARLPAALRESAVLAIVGGKGWGGVDVSTIAGDAGVADRVRLLGYVDEEQLSALYSGALFLAMPSLYEGFGLPLLEAMIRGTPVLTSRRASMPEVVGDAALLVEPEDVDSITAGLAGLLGDQDLRTNLAAKAPDRARQFTWDRTAAQTLEVFDKAIAMRPSAGRATERDEAEADLARQSNRQ